MPWLDKAHLGPIASRLQRAGRGFLAGTRRLGARAWPFAKVVRARAHDDPEAIAVEEGSLRLEGGDPTGRLGAERDFLLSLVHDMETEFLATGGGLMRLATQLSEIQRECQSLTDLTLGQTQDAAVQFAFQLLKKAEDLVLASYDQFDHVFATFRQLQERIARVGKHHDELMRVLLPLNFITISFRIEASRHPLEVQQAFSTLAGNVLRTVNEVRGTMERQFDDLRASEGISRALMEQVSASIRHHRREVTAALERSRNDLRALSEALTSSGAGVTVLSRLNQAVNSHIGTIVMAQQCQDITRQRIEHVGEAMDEMCTHLAEARTVKSGVEAETRHFVFRAGQIQLHQVQNVFDQLNRAANSLKGGIESLRTEAAVAAGVAVKVGGAALDTKVAGQCQAGIGETLSIAREAVQKIADIIAAFVPLRSSFMDCSGKARALASEMRNAGLNAQVFAIHATDGATLEVVAGRVRIISEEVIQLVETMGGSLNHTSEMVSNLRQRLEDFQELGRLEQEILAAESVVSREKLSEVESAIPLLIGRVTTQQGHFAQSVEGVLANVRFPLTVAAASSRSIGFFRALVAWGSEGGAPFTVESAAAEKIDRLQSKYTMESERLAHAEAFQPMPVVAGASAEDPSIEMFDDFGLPEPAVGDFSVETAHSSEPSEGLPRPVDLKESTTPTPKLAPPTESKKPEEKKELGDNVDLF